MTQESFSKVQWGKEEGQTVSERANVEDGLAGMEYECDSDGILTPPLPPGRIAQLVHSSVSASRCSSNVVQFPAFPRDALVGSQVDSSFRSSFSVSPLPRALSPTPPQNDIQMGHLQEETSALRCEWEEEEEEEEEVRPRKRRGRSSKAKKRRVKQTTIDPTMMDVDEAGPSQGNNLHGSVQVNEEPSTTLQLEPDFVFEPPDESMFAELRAFLDRQEEKEREPSSEEELVERDMTEKDYERQRWKKLQANQAILSKLGLAAPLSPSPTTRVEEEDREEQPTSSQQAARKRAAKGQRTVKLDADGTTTSLPMLGCTTEVAYVDVPMLRDRIRSQHLYFEDVPVAAAEKEALEEADWEVVDAQEERNVAEKQGRRVTLQNRRAPNGPCGEATAGEGSTCHQCRRKTDDEKMRCRFHESGKVCRLYWCRRCLDIRYGIDWDAESRSFHCPRCMGYCNCSLCLRRGGFSKFVPEMISAGLGANVRDEQGNKLYASFRHYIEAKVGREVKTGPEGLRIGNRGGGGKEKAKAKEKEKEADAKEEAAKERQMQRAAKKEEREGKRREEAKAKPKRRELEQGRKRKGVAKERGAKGGARVAHGKKAAVKRIKLTWKGKRKMGGTKASENVLTDKDVAFPAEKVVRGRRLQASEASASRVSDLNIWVKSKADEVDSSESESDAPTSTAFSDHSSEEAGTIDGSGFDEEEEEQEGEGEEDQGEEEDDLLSFSLPIGQVELSLHPKLTMTDVNDSSTDTPFYKASSEASQDRLGNLIEAYPHHDDGQDLAMVMTRLRDAGYL